MTVWQTRCLSPLPLQSAQYPLEYRLFFFCRYSDHSFHWLQAVRNEKLLLSVVPSSLCSHLRLCYTSWQTYIATAIHNVCSCLHGLNSNKQSRQDFPAALDVRYYRHDTTYGSAGDMILLGWTSDTIPQTGKHLTEELAVDNTDATEPPVPLATIWLADRTTPDSWPNGTILPSGQHAHCCANGTILQTVQDRTVELAIHYWWQYNTSNTGRNCLQDNTLPS